MKNTITTLLILFGLTVATFAQTKAPKTVAAQAKTILSAINRAKPSDAVFRAVVASYPKPANPLSVAVSVTATQPTSGKYLYTEGEYGYMESPDEMNAPGLTAEPVAFRFGGGRYLQSSSPVSASERTVWLRVRRTGNVPPTQAGVHRLLSHGRDFVLTWDTVNNSVTIYHPDPNTGSGSFGVLFFKNLPFLETFQTLIVRLKPDSVSLTVEGKTYTQAVPVGTQVSSDYFRLGVDTDGQYGTIEIKSAGIATRFLTDAELLKLIKP